MLRNSLVALSAASALLAVASPGWQPWPVHDGAAAWPGTAVRIVPMESRTAASARTDVERPHARFGAREIASGTIRGRVELRDPPGEIEGRPDIAALGMPDAHGQADRRRSVVYLETAPRAAFDVRDEPRAKMDQQNETFVPHLLAIVAGTTVDFPNNDHTYHNVFSFSKTRSFNLGRYAAGHSKSVRFDRPGIVRVFCDIHSHMSAYILVFAHRYFAVTDDLGRYRLENVPPGTYTVIAWNETTPQGSRRVVVPESGGDVEVNFLLGR